MRNEDFTKLVRQKGHELYRPMPWRDDTRPYYVLVSELMLQQTQVSRVLPKFNEFIAVFPDEKSLARSDLASVIRMWQGLGYNRRAKYLHDAAKMIVNEFDGKFPTAEHDILRLPGVGKNTCGAIRAYAFNKPSVFVETNIRTVYIHHFFADNFAVGDSEIITELQQTIDSERPREFYWALMDYGTWLKTSGVRNNSQSKHHKKQPPLVGSIREIRGQIIGVLSACDASYEDLQYSVVCDDRFEKALNSLVADGLVQRSGKNFHLTK